MQWTGLIDEGRAASGTVAPYRPNVDSYCATSVCYQRAQLEGAGDLQAQVRPLTVSQNGRFADTQVEGRCFDAHPQGGTGTNLPLSPG